MFREFWGDYWDYEETNDECNAESESGCVSIQGAGKAKAEPVYHHRPVAAVGA